MPPPPPQKKRKKIWQFDTGKYGQNKSPIVKAGSSHNMHLEVHHLFVHEVNTLHVGNRVNLNSLSATHCNFTKEQTNYPKTVKLCTLPWIISELYTSCCCRPECLYLASPSFGGYGRSIDCPCSFFFLKNVTSPNCLEFMNREVFHIHPRSLHPDLVMLCVREHPGTEHGCATCSERFH